MERLINNENKEIPSVTFSCMAPMCEWRTIGTIYLTNATDGYNVAFSPIMRECQNHHATTGKHDDHNMFRLSKNGNVIGQVSIPDQGFTGTIWATQ